MGAGAPRNGPPRPLARPPRARPEAARHRPPRPARRAGGPEAPPSPPVPLTRHAEMLLPIAGCRLRAAIIAQVAWVPGHFASRAGSPYPRAVPDSAELTPWQRRAAAAMLREPAAATSDLARLFAAGGHELALVGGKSRGLLLG